MKKILIVPDSFKGSLSAAEVADIIAEEAHLAFPQAEVLKVPVADGGEGLVDVVLSLMGGKRHTIKVHDPLMREISADYAELPNGAVVIEMAAAAGLPLLSVGERDVMRATTFGVGELILDAAKKGFNPIMVGLGGSATNDAGVGAARALGLQFWDADNQPVLYAHDLVTIERITASASFSQSSQLHLIFLSDVRNPLCGPQGASYIFGPQKGATPEQVEALDRGLMHLAGVIEKQTKRDLCSEPGIGAAGGFALPFMGYFQSELRSGIEFVLDLGNFNQKLAGTDLVISGEGRTDAQSAMGKAISAIARRCKDAGVPLVLLSGSVTPDAEPLRALGVTEMITITPEGMPLEQAMQAAGDNLRYAAQRFFVGILAGKLKR
ncbi:MAG: glycerate kinase [Anaerolineaceae bacterium]